jgi:hypothetical protein
VAFTKDGVVFANNSPTSIVFNASGSCEDDGSWSGGGNYRKSIVLFEAKPSGEPRPSGLVTTTLVYRLTGRVRGGGWVNE